MSSAPETVQEISRWFFDDYVPLWNELARDATSDPAVLLQYWSPPMHFIVEDPDTRRTMNDWATTEKDILAILREQHRPLRAASYVDTTVLDRRIFVYTPNAAGIDAIWSRRSVTAEIERLLVHFEVRRRLDGSWRVTSIVAQTTSEQTIDAARAAGFTEPN
ncbi:hypothetical protein [Nocardia brasiliensis]|uniref:DUF6841 family protein n=1 Tax=Nocardia brasiliensis TaxID=37326 RepID=UPI00189582DC|nr:hypothetical protein [Nocardia brasiliensis]MBF6127050.1 hypothetical protein [Nocardia brasiliensis]